MPLRMACPVLGHWNTNGPIACSPSFVAACWPARSPHTPKYVNRRLPSNGKMAALGDQSRATLEGQIAPQPRERDDEAISHANKEIDVRHAPKQPAHESRQADATELHDGGLPSDRRQLSVMTIRKRRRLGLAAHAGIDQPADVLPHLLCGGRNSRHRVLVLVENQGRVADRKDVGCAVNG